MKNVGAVMRALEKLHGSASGAVSAISTGGSWRQVVDDYDLVYVGLTMARDALNARLVERAAAGEEIVIAKSGRPRARLVPLEDTRALRVPGVDGLH